MRRASLATRISLLSVGIAVVTALVAGALAIGLIRGSGADTARQTLARLADVAESASTNNPTALAGQGRLRRALNGLEIGSGLIRPGGRVVTTSPLVQGALTSADIAEVLSGDAVSATRTVDGSTAFIEARPTSRGGLVLVQRRSDAVAGDERAIRRVVLALLIAGAVAAALGLLVAWRLALPLRRAAAAAHSLAAGDRDVRLPTEGPAEIADVSDAFNTLALALQQSEARQREFLLSVSHDLRTPLTAISGYAETLADGVVPAEEAGQVGSVLLREAQRLERMVGDLLDLARLGAQDFRVDLAPADLTAFVHDVAEAWTGRCAAHGVELRVVAPAHPIWANTDVARTRQALDGLFDNALRVTPSGTPIVLEVRDEGSDAALEVRDGGPGLRDEDLPVAFRQGVLYDRYRGIRQVGSGLGLAIVHGLVTRLGGTIEAGHAAEGGARFTMRLPR